MRHKNIEYGHDRKASYNRPLHSGTVGRMSVMIYIVIHNSEKLLKRP